jgi:hypothetical protein
LFTYVI